MSAPLRLLFVAEPSDAAEALAAVRRGGPVSAQLAPSTEVLRAAFSPGRDPWDAVVVVPGGPVEDVEVVAFVPDGIPVVVVAPEVPLLFSGTSARAVPRHDLAALAAVLQGPAVAHTAAYPVPDEPVVAPPRAERPSLGDGASGAAEAPTLSFSSPGTPGSAPSTSAPAPPTPMLDFRFGRSSAPPAPQPPLAPVPEPPAPVDRAPAPVPGPVPQAAPVEDPVLIIRPRVGDAPEAAAPSVEAPPEDVEVVEADAQPSILVVEDNSDTRMLLERILRATYDVKAVGDARSALLAMNERRFSGLVLDINLGGKETGADVLRIARSLPGYGSVFAIALTAYALPGDRERLLAAGFDEYISKPFTRQSLMETLAAGVAAA